MTPRADGQVKIALRLSCILVLAALLVGGGFAAGLRWRERTPRMAPVTAELELDAKNRPAALTQFITLPDGRTLLHGNQFKWEWNDEPIGCIVIGLQIERRGYHAGSPTNFASWNDPAPILTPGKPIDSAVLTKYPDEQ